MSKVDTRSSAECSIFGSPEDISWRKLPTYEDVMKYYHYMRLEIKQGKKEPSFKKIAVVVSQQLESLWKHASIPHLSRKRITSMLQQYRLKMNNILKSKSKASENFNNKVKAMQEFARNTLFDISACKCSDFSLCTCGPNCRVPTAERDFLSDQRSDRHMVIDRVDKATTVANRKRTERRTARVKQYLPLPPSNETFISGDVFEDSSSSKESGDESSDYDAPQQFRPHKRRPKGHVRDISVLAEACDRTGVSNRAAAFLASSLLQDAGVITESNTTSVIDKKRIERARKKLRMYSLAANKKALQPQSLYFDGRKDQSLTQKEINGSLHQRTIVEEHITLLSEPDSQYIGHFATTQGSSLAIFNGIINYFNSNEITLSTVKAIGCDGTAVNTGCKNGIIKLLEDYLNKPLQWIICLLHTNELPLRHLMKELDRGTSGPEHFAGMIGKQLPNCEQLDIVNFTAIPAPEIKTDEKDLSCDQKYLLNMFKAVTNGSASTQLASQKPGPLNHSRWLTTACRILRLYVATSEPSSVLLDLVRYIMNLYVPVWFSIKRRNSCSDGARHFFKLLNFSQSQAKRVRDIVNKVLQRNAFFAHPENILLAMLLDKDEHIRELGWRRILKSRIDSSKERRTFIVPKLLFDSNRYYGMIDWQCTGVSEPPLVHDISSAVIENNIKLRILPKKLFPILPCHTQAVERSVKLVTEASGCLVNSSERDGYILAKLDSRKKIPQFESKKDFMVLVADTSRDSTD